MLFNSYAFLLAFLPIAIIVGVMVDSCAWLRMAALIVLSLAFYSYWDPRFLPVLVASILLNWGAARAVASSKNRRIVTAAIIGNLALLGFFKYTNFFADAFTALGIPFGHINVILPLGISFFTFHHIMYLVDLGRGRAPLYPLQRYALYICFFPQAIAGPLVRWSAVMEQFGGRMLAEGWPQRWALGVTLIVIGLIEKVVFGDSLAGLIDPVYAKAAAGPIRDGSAWLAPAFAFQVFFDFAGYSDIAIGLALIFGIVLPPNFNAPFRATSISDFWQRWHMTLMAFLRDYVFLPLSGIGVSTARSRLVMHFAAIIITMALCGLWHGPTWGFVLWGVINGLGLVVATLWRRYLSSPPAWVGWALTISFFLATAVLFRATSIQAAWNIFDGLTVAPDFGRLLRNGTVPLAAICAVALPASQDIAARLLQRPSNAVAAALALASVSILVWLGNNESYDFIYFQF